MVVHVELNPSCFTFVLPIGCDHRETVESNESVQSNICTSVLLGIREEVLLDLFLIHDTPLPPRLRVFLLTFRDNANLDLAWLVVGCVHCRESLDGDQRCDS